MQYMLQDTNKGDNLFYLDELNVAVIHDVNDELAHSTQIVFEKILTEDAILIVFIHENILKHLVQAISCYFSQFRLAFLWLVSH